MAAPIGYTFTKRPLDRWSTREKLSLASSVRRNGDQNWVSVSRAIKPFAENSRPQDWFSQKNCALQYADLLEKAETPKRKRGDKNEREVVETPANQIVRKLTIERIEELKQLIQDEQQRYKQLKKEVECIRGGQYDDRLTDMWEKITTEKKAAEEKKKEEERKVAEEAAERARLHAMRKVQGLQRTTSSVSSPSEMDESTQDSIPEHLNVETTDDEMPATPTPVRPISIEIPHPQAQELTKSIPPTSPLLSSLLQSKQISVDSLQQIKAEAEAEHALKQTQAANQAEAALELTKHETEESIPVLIQEIPSVDTLQLVDEMTPLETTVEDMDAIMMIPDVKGEVDVETTEHVIEVDTSHIKEEIIECEHIVVEETVEITTHESPIKNPPIKLETPSSNIEETEVMEVPPASSFVNVDDEVCIRDEPPSPASSVSSRISETGSKSSSRRSKGGRTSTGSRRGSTRVTRRSNADDLSSRPSDIETSDDDGDSSIINLVQSGMSAFSESIPNSPLSHCSDTEDDKAYKTWKKSIMLVWRAAANHKYANVFLHHVTDDIAPGYSSVVRRPKDLTIIKRQIENGTIRTTPEFQRDMMLMFTNAIMYNSSNHDVYKMAEEMYNDVMEHIEQYVSTQIMVQNSEAKLLRPTRRNESSDKEEESRRRRTSSEAQGEGGKTKKRKSRAEES